MNGLLPPVGTIVKVQAISLVKHHFYRDWQIVAEADVLVSGSSNGQGKVIVGKIPIDEISPYPDFDPACFSRNPKLQMKMYSVLLRASDLQFLVIDHNDIEEKVVLSLKQAVERETTVSRTDHKPSYIVQGFRHLQNLHCHLLKHPLGMGGEMTPWSSLLGVPYNREGILLLLRNLGCPAAHQYDGKTYILQEKNPCSSCPTVKKLQCFKFLQPVRKPYEQQAVFCVDRASDRNYPRHYHYAEEKEGERKSVLVFMDEHCRKVVAKRGEEPYFTVATFFQPKNPNLEVSDERLKYQTERRTQIAPIIGRASCSDVKICTPLSWGYGR